MEENTRKRIDSYFNMGNEKLESAKANLNGNRIKAAISDAYYVMFNAASALVVFDGKVPSSHKFVISYVNQSYCNTERLPKYFGRWLKEAEGFRLKADYDPDFEEEWEPAKHLLEQSDIYIQEVKR